MARQYVSESARRDLIGFRVRVRRVLTIALFVSWLGVANPVPPTVALSHLDAALGGSVLVVPASVDSGARETDSSSPASAVAAQTTSTQTPQFGRADLYSFENTTSVYADLAGDVLFPITGTAGDIDAGISAPPAPALRFHLRRASVHQLPGEREWLACVRAHGLPGALAFLP